MKKQLLDQIIKNKENKSEFAIITNIVNGESCIYEKNKPIDKNGKPTISYIDQFPEPKNMEQGLFLQKLSDALEGSKNIIITPLPVGTSVVANNYFWLHGRKPFVENKKLSRELLRIRGSFFTN